MTPERWRRIDQLLERLIDLDLGERAGFLDEACAGDPSLRRDVSSLMEVRKQAEEFIESPPHDAMAELFSRPPSESLIGRTVSHYRILRPLGAGGMGKVWLAVDNTLGRKVALKFLPAQFTQDAQRLHRFEQEAKAASALNHPNIITIYEIGEADGERFIATEFIDGVTLRQRMKNEKLPLNVALDTVVQIASALDSAHTAGIIHRDIKPENVMARPDGLVKVLDFGLAKLMERPAARQESVVDSPAPAAARPSTEPGMVIGTVNYMSPEQARGLKVDHRTDIFSLGVMMYEMVAGRRPFEGETASDVIAAILQNEPPPVGLLRPDLPPELERIVSRMLEKEREARYQSAAELRVELQRLQRKVGAVADEKAGTGEAPAVTTAEQAAEETKREKTTVVTDRERIKRRAFTRRSWQITAIGRGRTSRKAALALSAILIIASAVIAHKLSSRNQPVVDPVELSQTLTTTLLTGAGNIGAFAISPDGKYVAYSMTDAQQLNSLWIKHLPTLSDTEIIRPGEFILHAVGFSSLGDYIYYVGRDSRTNMASLYQMPLLGGPSKKLIDDVDSRVSFSPDGRRFVFRRQHSARRESLLIVANADGAEEREIAAIKYPEDFGRPAWSPDGKVIACAAGHADGGENKYIVEVKVGDWALKEISSKRWRWVGDMAWLSDGSGLLMIAAGRANEPYQVWRLSYPAGQARRITNTPGHYNNLSLSADSRTLLAMAQEMVANVWIVPAEDTSLATPITSGGGHYGKITWTPDGKIVYDSHRGGAIRDISVMDADGGNQRPLVRNTTNPGYVGAPIISRDGRYMVFASDPSGARHIWRTDIDGGNPVQLTNGKGEWVPSLSPDGRWVFYSDIGSDKPTMWKVSIDGGEPVRLTDVFSFAPAVSPNGKLIACSYLDEHPGSWWRIAIFPIEGGQPIKVLPHPIVQSRAVQWTPDGRSLTYLNPNDMARNIWLQSLEGGEPKRLTDFKSDRLFDFSWSHDGKYLACVRGIWSRNLVLLRSKL